MWSRTSMLFIIQLNKILDVKVKSSSEGRALPFGWLWQIIILSHWFISATFVRLLISTGTALAVPLLISFVVSTRFAVFKQIT